jgi:exopolysaccharide biosynthesis polyprenyl glycosylphosphotransferase
MRAATRSSGEALVHTDAHATFRARHGEVLAVRRHRQTTVARRRGRMVRRTLVVADLLGLALAFALLQLLIGPGGDSENRVALDGEALFFLASLPAWVILAQALGLYDRDEERPEHTTVDDLAGVFQLVTVCVWLMFVAAYLTGFASPDLGKWVIFWALAVGLIALSRSTGRTLARRKAAYTQNVVIVGADQIGQLVARKLCLHPEYGIRIVGFVDSAPEALRSELHDIPVLGERDRLDQIVIEHNIDRVIVAFPREPVEDSELKERVSRLQAMGVRVDIVPRLCEALGPNVSFNPLEGLQLVSLPPTAPSRAMLVTKRVFDLVAASILLVLSAPLFLAIAIWIKIDSRGPAFFRQVRLGIDQTPFVALKFRTMKADTSPDAHRSYVERTMDSGAAPEAGGVYKLERPDALTRAGRWLRQTSLDELPQLINVLRGEMSLVGPRPCIPYETRLFKPHHFERFSVPAGITGLWQVKARAYSTYGEALELDVAYARSWSFSGDLMLLLQTPLQVLRPKGTR